MDFEIIDVSGDVGIRASGRDIKELFVNAALGLYNLITDIKSVRPQRSINVEVRDDSLEGLLVRFLNELIFQFDTYGFIGNSLFLEGNIKNGTLEASENYWLKAEIKGEDFDPERHERRLLVKAATYHNLRLYKEDGLWKADLIFDI